MVRKKEEIRVRKVSERHGGLGDVTFFDWLLPEEAKGHGKTFSMLAMPPHSSIGHHTHYDTFGAYYVLEGNPTIDDDGTEVTLGVGDMHLCRAGCSHAVRNDTDGNVAMITLEMNNLGDMEKKTVQDIKQIKQDPPFEIGSIVQHFKRKLISEEERRENKYLYEILDYAEHTETGQAMVVYKALYGDFRTYVRPYDMFCEPVDKEKYPEVKQVGKFELYKS